MTEVVLFHHVQGLTDGVVALADALRARGHTVHTPDLFEGECPPSIEEGVAHVRAVGEDVLAERADAAVAALPQEVVFAGISYGAAIAQRLSQTRAGCRGALFYESCLPISGEWAIGPWPDGLPVQVHGMVDDPIFAREGDLDAARQLVDTVGPGLGELFVYPGDRHLFVDSSLPSYDVEATALAVQRSAAFLDRVG
jgi:dienelactone hydrolase